MDNKKEKLLSDTFTNKLKDTHRNGMLQGCKAMCKVIYDKANDINKTPEQRIEDIIKFCNVSLKSKD